MAVKPRTAELVLVTPSGGLIGSLPAEPVATPWWQRVHCETVAPPMSEMGQFLPSSFASGMEELASIPDASERNCWIASGCCSHRWLAASLRRQVLPCNRTPRRATVASAMGQKLP